MGQIWGAGGFESGPKRCDFRAPVLPNEGRNTEPDSGVIKERAGDGMAAEELPSCAPGRLRLCQHNLQHFRCVEGDWKGRSWGRVNDTRMLG